MHQQRISSSMSYTPMMNQNNQLGFGPLSQQTQVFQQQSQQQQNLSQMGQNNRRSHRGRSPNQVSQSSVRGQSKVSQGSNQAGVWMSSQPKKTQQQSTRDTSNGNRSRIQQASLHSLSQDCNMLQVAQDGPVHGQKQQQNSTRGHKKDKQQSMMPLAHFQQQSQVEEVVQNSGGGLDDEKVFAQVKAGIQCAMQNLELEREQVQANIVQDVFLSKKFHTIRENFYQTIQEKRRESEGSMDLLCKEMDGLVKYVKLNRKEYKRDAEQRKINPEVQETARRGNSRAAVAQDRKKVSSLDITDDMLNLFVRFDVQRRFFNIVSMEILAKQFGLKEAPSLRQLRKEQSKVSLQNLIMNGRNLTLEQYFEFKEDFESNPKAKEQLIRDRQTHLEYVNGNEDSQLSCVDDQSSSKSCSSQDDQSEEEKMQVTQERQELSERSSNDDESDQASANESDSEASSSSTSEQPLPVKSRRGQSRGQARGQSRGQSRDQTRRQSRGQSMAQTKKQEKKKPQKKPSRKQEQQSSLARMNKSAASPSRGNVRRQNSSTSAVREPKQSRATLNSFFGLQQMAATNATQVKKPRQRRN